ncbi:hypothetical protein CEXT_271261 [Caerostris extrusa]|uniref:Uncharacterized protein n=1 Tax=Caerostris extrusa TaxID=172846 RepID=A0AAV4V6N5_CAEEX|nr:hypothetical protein CEXT_271261 [Caerostris extrusa]
MSNESRYFLAAHYSKRSKGPSITQLSQMHVSNLLLSLSLPHLCAGPFDSVLDIDTLCNKLQSGSLLKGLKTRSVISMSVVKVCKVLWKYARFRKIWPNMSNGAHIFWPLIILNGQKEFHNSTLPNARVQFIAVFTLRLSYLPGHSILFLPQTIHLGKEDKGVMFIWKPVK